MSLPIDRIIEKLDEYLDKNDLSGAERHLKYWLEEARQTKDFRGSFTILNELVGFYRKIGKRDEAYSASSEALKLVENMEITETVSAATAYINVATAYKSFGDWKKALSLYKKAKIIYEKNLKNNDGRLGGLYNNMALCLTDAGDFDGALDLFNKALKVMELTVDGELEQAITCLNIADLIEQRDGLEKGSDSISDLVSKAQELMQKPDIKKDGYFAFVAEKCIPGFKYYGFFAFAKELQEICEKIRAGEK